MEYEQQPPAPPSATTPATTRLPRPASTPARPVEEEAKDEVDRFRGLLSRVWKQARSLQRTEIEARLAEIAKQAAGFTARLKSEPAAVLRDARKLGVEVGKIAERMDGPPATGDAAGMLEGA